MEMHFAIAKTVSFIDPDSEVATAEYQKAIEIAQKQGSEEVLKEFYLQQILAYVDVRLMDSSEYALKAIENYLELDKSNSKVFACMGVVRFQNGDNKGAIEAFQQSLELNKRDHEVGIALLRTMFKMKDYDGMVSQIEHYGHLTVGFWLRESLESSEHRMILYAARATNKLSLLIHCYEHEIQNTQLSDEDPEAMKDADPMEKARLTLRSRTRNTAASSMFRVYLGWLYLEFLGQSDKAFELWKTAFFQRSEFFNLGNLYSSLFATDIIPDFFALFSQLIYEKALDPDPEVSERMLSLLENLQRREKAFYELDEYHMTDFRNMSLLLAKLYLKHGRKEEARKMLNEQFQRAIDILQDDIDWNDRSGYDVLAGLLFLNGQLENAKLAVSLKRFFASGFEAKLKGEEIGTPGHGRDNSYAKDAERKEEKVEGQEQAQDNTNDDDSTASNEGYVEWWAQTTCAGWYVCKNDSVIPYGATAYTCTTCVNVDFCERCYDNLRNGTGKERLFVCNPSHDFIKTPPEGLERIKHQTITMNGKSVSFVNWLEEVRKEWRTGLCFKS
jgi:tetratricopeptide (TPR) repeat protein